MQFIETTSEARSLLEKLQSSQSVINFYNQWSDQHSANNQLCALLVNVDSENYVISFGHPDVKPMPIQYLKLLFETDGKKIIFDRKNIKYFVSNIKNAVDYKVCSYFKTKEEISENFDLKRSNDMRSIPIMNILKHFKNLVSTLNYDLILGDVETDLYELEFSDALYNVEKNGMFVENFTLGSQHLVNDKNLVYGQYNMLTPTGRPSNRFGNINFAALNKKTNERDCFVSRFSDGLLVMVDYESYHLRLLGNYLNYELPKTSLHEYLGKLYHGKQELTEDEYELSKKITFNLIYGGISDDVKNNVPFMNEISKYVDKVWNFYTNNKYVKTWFYKRKILPKFFGEKVNSYKIFNYLLQSAETEQNCNVLLKINNFLQSKKTKLVLYTYDAFLFDIPGDEFSLIKEIKPIITSNDSYPIRIYYGRSYGSMKEMKL